MTEENIIKMAERYGSFEFGETIWFFSKEEILDFADCCGGELNEKVDRLEREKAELIAKAEAVIARWGTPNWKEANPTAEALYLLRDAVERVKEVDE